jgi:hypothetical protein
LLGYMRQEEGYAWSGLGFGWVGMDRMGGFEQEELWRWGCIVYDRLDLKFTR